MSYFPNPMYVVKTDESYFRVDSAKYRDKVEVDTIFNGDTYRDDPVPLLNVREVSGFTAGHTTAGGVNVYVGNAKAINSAASESSTPAAYASDLVSHTAPRKKETKKSMYLWYDSPPLVRTVTTTSGSVTVTMSSTTGLIVGMTLAGTGIPTGSMIVSITNATDFVISQPCTASASVAGTFTGNIVGDCWVADYSHQSGNVPTYMA